MPLLKFMSLRPELTVLSVFSQLNSAPALPSGLYVSQAVLAIHPSESGLRVCCSIDYSYRTFGRDRRQPDKYIRACALCSGAHAHTKRNDATRDLPIRLPAGGVRGHAHARARSYTQGPAARASHCLLWVHSAGPSQQSSDARCASRECEGGGKGNCRDRRPSVRSMAIASLLQLQR